MFGSKDKSTCVPALCSSLVFCFGGLAFSSSTSSSWSSASSLAYSRLCSFCVFSCSICPPLSRHFLFFLLFYSLFLVFPSSFPYPSAFLLTIFLLSSTSYTSPLLFLRPRIYFILSPYIPPPISLPPLPQMFPPPVPIPPHSLFLGVLYGLCVALR